MYNIFQNRFLLGEEFQPDMYLFNLCHDVPVGIKFSRNPYVFMLFLEANLLIKNLLSLYICFLFSDVFNFSFSKKNCISSSCDRPPAWPDLAKFHQSVSILKVFGNCSRDLLIFGRMLNHIWKLFYAIGHIFIFKIGKYWKIKIAIWAHCRPPTSYQNFPKACKNCQIWRNYTKTGHSG